jgi:hypothetical protein
MKLHVKDESLSKSWRIEATYRKLGDLDKKLFFFYDGGRSEEPT